MGVTIERENTHIAYSLRIPEDERQDNNYKIIHALGIAVDGHIFGYELNTGLRTSRYSRPEALIHTT